MASLVYLVLYVYLHACAARPLMALNKETVAAQILVSSKDVKSSVAERFVKHGNRASDHDTNVVLVDNQKFSSVKEEAENIEGKKVKTPYSWKTFQQAIGTETWKKADRSTLEYPSPPPSTVRNEDIDVMDYAQPHRKPPIHNRGT